jgi:hypothetical protein
MNWKQIPLWLKIVLSIFLLVILFFICSVEGYLGLYFLLLHALLLVGIFKKILKSNRKWLKIVSLSGFVIASLPFVVFYLAAIHSRSISFIGYIGWVVLFLFLYVFPIGICLLLISLVTFIVIRFTNKNKQMK